MKESNEDEIITIIERAIKEDLDNSYVSYEDTLKNVFYFYLRNKLKGFLIDDNIRMFTEFHDGKLSVKE